MRIVNFIQFPYVFFTPQAAESKKGPDMRGHNAHQSVASKALERFWDKKRCSLQYRNLHAHPHQQHFLVILKGASWRPAFRQTIAGKAPERF